MAVLAPKSRFMRFSELDLMALYLPSFAFSAQALAATTRNVCGIAADLLRWDIEGQAFPPCQQTTQHHIALLDESSILIYSTFT
jgi:hypothetical protein